MTLERRIHKLERLLSASPESGPLPLCTCYPTPPTFRNEAEMEAAAQRECPQHGKRFRFCLIAPLALSEAQWTERKRRPSRQDPENGE
jgi:hypothetical protein